MRATLMDDTALPAASVGDVVELKIDGQNLPYFECVRRKVRVSVESGFQLLLRAGKLLWFPPCSQRAEQPVHDPRKSVLCNIFVGKDLYMALRFNDGRYYSLDKFCPGPRFEVKAVRE